MARRGRSDTSPSALLLTAGRIHYGLLPRFPTARRAGSLKSRNAQHKVRAMTPYEFRFQRGLPPNAYRQLPASEGGKQFPVTRLPSTEGN